MDKDQDMSSDGARDAEKEPVNEQDIRRLITDEECEGRFGYDFPVWKKRWILTVIFFVQTSMNFNTSLYSNGITGISEEFHVSEQTARWGAALFLIFYAFGCELWAPWSEEIGRAYILQASLALTNMWAIPVGLASNIDTVLVFRALGGLSTAGGSVTLGMVSDLYDSDSQERAIAFVVFSSVFGSILGPVIGGFVELLPPKEAWRWCIWIQLIFGGAVQFLHFLTVPETHPTRIKDRVAKKLRETGADVNVWGPGELETFRQRFSWKELWETWSRALYMLLTEHIVFWLSLLSGVSDAIVFIQIQSMNLVYKQWDFNSWEIGLAFLPFALGYGVAWFAFVPTFRYAKRERERNPNSEYAKYEIRLRSLVYTALFLPVGLLIFGWTGQPRFHWGWSMVGTTMIGIANYSIYMSTIDYMISTYRQYSASATGGNGLARDLLAGIFTVPAIPFYTKIGAKYGMNLQWASSILAAAAFITCIGAFFIRFNGETLRKKSKMAQEVRAVEVASRPPSSMIVAGAAEVAQVPQNAQDAGDAEGAQEPAAANPVPIPGGQNIDLEQGLAENWPSFGPSSPQGSYMASVHAASRHQSRQASRNASPAGSRRNSHQEGSTSSIAVSLAERLAEQLGNLGNLGSIDSVVNEPENQ
ncbi:major facilitator superfamily domain-containing protein [Nemania sp. FL0031]|nr:major facilitator superfamily domain-containing protein [Nemania sp. FL0031]